MKLRRHAVIIGISSGALLMLAHATAAQVTTSYENLLLGTASPIEIAILIINWALGILALIALIIILWGAFVWMFSRGDEEKITRAKAILRNGLIGLVIILAAWGIARYVINLLLDVTGAGNEYSTPYEPYEPSSGSPFTIDHTNPSDGEENVPLCHLIAVTFSYPVNQESITADSFVVTIPSDAVGNPNGGKDNSEACSEDVECLSGACSESGRCEGDQLAGSFAFSESDYAAVFYPASDYLMNTTYEVELTTDVEGVDPESGAVYNLTSGDPKRNFTFTTGTETDETPPKVDVVDVTPSPEDGATEICLNPTLQVSFSESLDPASPSDSNFWLYEAGSDVSPSDELDIDYIRMSSIGGEADDTIATKPQDQLETFTEYGINLFSGDASTETFAGAIYDTCGNPLSGDFDDEMEGSTTDDFVDPTSAASSQGFTYQWTWITGDQAYCVPEIDSISQQDNYYSEDQDPTGETGDEDTGKVVITGDYLYPFYDVDFYYNVSAAGMTCFDTNHVATMSCFVGNSGGSEITVRTPVASQTGRITVENADGSDTSADVATISSPFIRNTSPLEGPAGQYVTIRGKNFVDYDPSVEGSERGRVFFDDTEAEVMCDDGWDDDAIIVRVPDGFAIDDTPNIQVVTAAEKYSNEEGFTITDGDPGPGLCELEPSCSDTGADDITAIGENFGDSDDSGTVYFDPSDDYFVEGDVSQWNVYNDTYGSYTVVTSGTPVTEPDTYTFTAGNALGISNGLDFNITCSEPPELFQSYQCDFENTVYLPNPRGYEDDACVNSDIAFAFNQNMSDSTVTGGVKVYQCTSGETFDETACTTEVGGSFESGYLNNAYIGGDGSVNLDGSRDIDGDGDTDVDDAASLYYFSPTENLAAGYFYKVVIPTAVTNDNSVPLTEEYSWYFQVRSDASNCSVEYLSLHPSQQTENKYEAADACIDNYTVSSTNYSYRASAISANCLLLNDAGTYTWSIDDGNILGFGENDVSGDRATSQTSDSTTNGYNTVCLQGDETENTGEATVKTNVLDPDDGSVAATDDALVIVDFGYCTQDSDCYTQDCRDTYCDPETSHCAPDITSFSPNKSSGADVGPTGCITINGCYFGTDQQQSNSCTCESLKEDGETCQVTEGSSTCLLDDGTTLCSLGEVTCTLSESCTEESAEADYSLGYFRGCTCTISSDQSCLVDSGETTCVADGTDTCSADDSTYTAGSSGSVTLDGTAASYPDATLCEDTWDDGQIIIQIPEDDSVPAGDYGITVTSSYQLSDTFGTKAGDSYDCTVGDDPTPCLCRVDPDEEEEGEPVDLYGEGFDTLVDDGGEKVTFTGSVDRVEADGSETWVDANKITDAIVPEGAVTDEDGVQLESDTLTSNALEFAVSCNSNFDCGTGCCSAGQCAPAEQCITCTSDTDCTYGSCQSTCTNGICAPYITALSPDEGAVGQPVTIQGCYFGSYYDPTAYDPGSLVTVDDIEADLACNETDAWSNQQIIITMPDGIFTDADDTTADVQVQQVYTNDGTQQSQTSNTVAFTQDNSCSEVDIPVLCDARPAYSPYQTLTDSTRNIKLSGENFYDQEDGYCTCQLDTLGECRISEGNASCTTTETETFFVNPDNTSEQCDTSTLNAYTVYNSSQGKCVYTDPEDTSITCTIDVGDTSCSISTSETCYTDSGDTSIVCDSSIGGFVSLDGSVEYTNDVPANIDWTNYYETQYLTDVPESSETGDVTAIATTSDNVQCTSNGLGFPVTCNSCSDCASGDNLNCNLDYDPSFGACTADTTGFCRAEPDSCCDNTSCVYDDSDSSDAGTCAPQPLITETIPEAGATGVCSNGQFAIEFDRAIITSDAYSYNNNEISEEEIEKGIDVTADDIALEDIDFEEYVRLRPASYDDADTTSVLSDVEISSDQKTLTLILDSILDFSKEYEIIIDADDAVASGGDYQQGIVSLADGVAVGCTSDQEALGMCGDGFVKLTFTTIDRTNYADTCGPAYVILEADDEEFADNNYIFTEAEQEESLTATVYSAGEDHYPDDGDTDANGDTTDDGDDDQVIQRIDDGTDDGFYWTYDWDPLYATLEDLENNSCPVAGILTGEDDSSFNEDQETQTVTADSPDKGEESTDTIAVTVTGDGSVEQGWGNPTVTRDDLTDSVLVDVQYCASTDYLVSFESIDYHFVWSFCRGDDPEADSFLPEFETIFERSERTTPSIDDAYDADMEFIYEVAFKDADALPNDPTTNNNTIAIRLYPNNLDGDRSSIGDSVSPSLWYLLNTNDTDTGYSETTVDDYQAITVGNTTYVAISDLSEHTGGIYPYVFVLAYSTEASDETKKVVDALINGLRFNRNESLSVDCALEKAGLIRDTKRVNDLGTIAYLLSSYYYNDSDGNDADDFSALETGSYIVNLTTSIWPSWDATLGNALGQSLPVDPTNAFDNAENNCPYDPPDVSAGETTGTYYDEAGTCWDPVLKDFYGPDSSYVYLYQYHDGDDFALYANLEYINDETNSYNPCRLYDDGTTVSTSISDFSDQGCATFDYVVEDSVTTDNSTYARLFK